MAYNSYYPMYPQYFNTMQNQQVQQPQQQPQTGIIWVSGIAGAKGFLVAPNTTVQLWDSEAQIIYLKSADASGMPSIKIIDYTIRDMSQPIQQQPTQSTAYVTQKEFDELKQQVQQILGGRKDESTISTADDKRRNR